MNMTDEERTEWVSVRDRITTATGYLDERQASTVAELFGPWRKSDWQDYELNVMRRHAGRLWKFSQPRLNDENQNVEPGTGGAESIWTEIAYHDGVRTIPDTFLPSQKFELDELGWWHGSANAEQGVYKSTLSVANTWTPEEYPSGWALVRAE